MRNFKYRSLRKRTGASRCGYARRRTRRHFKKKRMKGSGAFPVGRRRTKMMRGYGAFPVGKRRTKPRIMIHHTKPHVGAVNGLWIRGIGHSSVA